jgi:tetraacyldisaccharide 4'-kinase
MQMMTGDHNPPALRRVLAPLATLYGGAIALRNRYCDSFSFATRAARIPVISVGNISVGGTGKTPLVIEIVRRLRAAGRRPAIVTRGYAAKAGQVADEVLEFGLGVPDVPVVVNPDRAAGAESARVNHRADCVVLDDGFQHRWLRRDLDVVLIDALDPWGGERLLPAGRLREPLDNLARADWFVISRTNQVPPERVQEIVERLGQYAPQAPVTKAAVAAEGLFGANGSAVRLRDLSQRRALPVCGVGNPSSFVRLMQELTGGSCEPLIFRDHHRYAARDVEKILSAAVRQQADLVVTTRKDWVKLHALWPASNCGRRALELHRLDARLVLADARGEFATRLEQVFKEHL